MTTETCAAIPDELLQLTSIAIAYLDDAGNLLAANAGFLRLLAVQEQRAPQRHVAPAFIQPPFMDLIARPPEAEGVIHTGLFTIGDYSGIARTLTGRLVRRGKVLHFIAEQDIDELETLQAKVLELNHELANSQRQVTRMNRDLESLVAIRTAALSASETRFRSLVEQSLVGICIVQGTRFRYANPALAALTDHTSSDELAGLDLLQFVVPEDRVRVENSLLSAGTCSTARLRFDFAASRKDGARSVIEGHGSYCEFEGQPALIAILLDVTERHRSAIACEAALAEAERLSRLKTEFLNNMSHELLTPLNGVIGFADIGRRARTLATASDACARIGESGRKLLTIVEDVLDFSGVEGGNLALDAAPFDLRAVIDKATGAARILAGDRGLVFNEELADGLPRYCMADGKRVAQILANLLSNAVKFTEHGTISLAANPHDGEVWFRVADTGIGMSPEHLERLFHPFEQADGSSRRRFGGTGLGLALTHQLVGKMGGSIKVASTLGRGTAIDVRLPLVPVADADLLPEAPPGKKPAPSLLLVENDEIGGMLLETLAQLQGMQVTWVVGSEPALEQLGSGDGRRFDLVIISDDLAPGPGGYELARRIAARHPALPMIGAFLDPPFDTNERCQAAGMREWLPKPYQREVLLDILVRYTPPVSQIRHDKVLDERFRA